MQYSPTGLHLTELFESCRLHAYQDQKGIWTIGYGHTANVKPGDVCTVLQAENWLMLDVEFAAREVERSVVVPLSQGEFDALVDFVFNVGIGNWWISTARKYLNEGDFSAACYEIEKWDKITGTVNGVKTSTISAGLLRRRIAEVQEFESGNASD